MEKIMFNLIDSFRFINLIKTTLFNKKSIPLI